MSKGAITIQFNWIFVLIAGATILLFFFGVVDWQKRSTDSRVNAAILTNLNTILTGTKVIESSTNPITIPNVEVGFDCNKYFIGDTNIQIKSRTFFAPGSTKGTLLLTHSIRWDMPFKIMNFLFITSPQLRYIFVDDGTPSSKNLLEEVNKSLPPDYMVIDGKKTLTFNKEIQRKITLSTKILDENNYKVKFIFFNTNEIGSGLTNIDYMPDKDVTAIEILDPDIINFYQKKGSKFVKTGQSHYLTTEEVIAAIFSEDAEMYNCSIKKAYKQLSITSQIYHNRSYDLMNHYNNMGKANCAYQHSSASIDLTAMSGYAYSISNGIDIRTNMNKLRTEIIPRIRAYNDNLGVYSCELIY